MRHGSGAVCMVARALGEHECDTYRMSAACEQMHRNREMVVTRMVYARSKQVGISQPPAAISASHGNMADAASALSVYP